MSSEGDHLLISVIVENGSQRKDEQQEARRQERP